MDSLHRKARVRDVIVLCCWARQFSIKSGPPHPGVYMGSQIKFQGSKGGGGGERKGKKGVVACDILDIHFRREAVLIVALCYINQKKSPDWMSHSRTDFYYPMINHTQRIANIKLENI